MDKKNFISFLEQDDARGNYGLINYLLAHIHNVCTIKTTPTKANGETCSLYRNKYMEDLANKTEKLLDRRELVDAYTRRDIDLQIDGAIQVQSVIAKCCEYVNQNYKGKSLSRVYTHIEREYNKIINEQRGAAERAHVKNKRHK